MKLNYKRTLLVGFAFFLICAFWQAYDTIIPIILTNKFGMNQTWSGLIMALDNILALFMLPLFGSLSDKCRSKMGRRTPYILYGTIAAVAALILLGFVDAAQLKKLGTAAKIDDPAALEIIYDQVKDTELLTPEGETIILADQFDRDSFAAIRSDADKAAFTSYVVPARSVYVHSVTSAEKGCLIAFIVVLMIILISMATFRSPAVALMPDVTIPPLRSKANALINLMGTAGGMLVLGLGMVFATSAVRNQMMSYTGFFAAIAVIMLVSLLVFMLTVREPKWAGEMRDDCRKYGIDLSEKEEACEKRGLSAAEKRSLLFILVSIVLWFFGYNAVTSKYSVYAGNVLHKDYNLTLLIAQGAAIVSYLPVGIAASRFGRKKTILAGIVMLTTAFAAAAFMKADSPALLMNIMFALAGIGWATINVNSFPMVVEMASGSDIGKYTGYYYSASMAAQVATPIVSGFLMDKMGMRVLFPYAAVFAGLAFLTMRNVHHGDSRPAAGKGLEAYKDAE